MPETTYNRIKKNIEHGQETLKDTLGKQARQEQRGNEEGQKDQRRHTDLTTEYHKRALKRA